MSADDADHQYKYTKRKLPLRSDKRTHTHDQHNKIFRFVAVAKRKTRRTYSRFSCGGSWPQRLKNHRLNAYDQFTYEAMDRTNYCPLCVCVPLKQCELDLSLAPVLARCFVILRSLTRQMGMKSSARKRQAKKTEKERRAAWG